MEFFTNDGARTGLYFGATSGVITTIGLIAGLNAGTNSVAAVLGGILVIAVADSLSDALGIHLAEEADPETSHSHVWSATVSTFLTKFASKVLIVHRRDQLRASKIMADRAKKNEKISFEWDSVVEEVLGKEKENGRGEPSMPT